MKNNNNSDINKPMQLCFFHEEIPFSILLLILLPATKTIPFSHSRSKQPEKKEQKNKDESKRIKPAPPGQLNKVRIVQTDCTLTETEDEI
jgi:hypothetical protein